MTHQTPITHHKYSYRYTDTCESYDLMDGQTFDEPLADAALEAAVRKDCQSYDTNAMEITLHVYEMVWKTSDPDDLETAEDDWDDEVERLTITLPGLDVDRVDDVHVFEIRGDDTDDVWSEVIAADLESAEKFAGKTYPGEEYYVNSTSDDGDSLPPMGKNTPIVDRDGDVIANR